MTGAAVRVGLPPLAAMFNMQRHGVRRDGEDRRRRSSRASSSGSTATGFPSTTGSRATSAPDYEITPCLEPLSSLRNDIHVISGIDNPNARVTAPGQRHHKSMSGLVSGTPFTGRGAGGPSIDQVIAGAIGGESRFRSLQIGVCQESFGESIQRNMSWAGYDRALPPEMIPHSLFDRLFGAREQAGSGARRASSTRSATTWRDLQPSLGQADQQRLDEHLTSVRELERAIASLPPDYGKNVKEPEDVARPEGLAAHREAPVRPPGARAGLGPDARRLLHADQVPEPGRGFPWLGYTRLRHHDYTHTERGVARRAAHHARHLPLARRGVRLPARQAEVDPGRRRHPARPHAASSSSTSTPRRTRTRTTASR